VPEREQRHRSEAEPSDPYLRAASFESDTDALHAYSLAQSLIFRNNTDLSTYRLRYKDAPHVVVLGLQPPAEINSTLEAILAGGAASTLPFEVIQALMERRRRAQRLGPWVEGHYRPGKPM
jgi:hypothetical protein